MKDSYIKACDENNYSLVRELLSSGADVNWRTGDDRDGWSGLHIAAYHNYGELVELLLAHPGVDVNLRTNDKRTPLMLACIKGRENIVRRLCQVTNIQLNSKDKHDWTMAVEAEEWTVRHVRVVMSWFF